MSYDFVGELTHGGRKYRMLKVFDEDTVCPHQSLGYTPPARDVFKPVMGSRFAPQPRPSPPTALEPKLILH